MSFLSAGTTRPFGYAAPNGLNFASSVHNSKSRLARVIRYMYVAQMKGVIVTRRKMIEDIFNRQVGERDYSSAIQGPANLVGRGWGAYLFTGMVACGFLTMKRTGRSVVYTIGPKAHLVTVV